MANKPKTITTDTGPFFVAPLWVLEAVSAPALKLYLIMGAKYGTMRNGEAVDIFPSRSTLGGDIGCSVDTIDRLITELETAGALRKEMRHNPKGDPTSNAYTLITVPPREDGRTHAARGGRTHAPTVAAPTRLRGRTHAARSRPNDPDPSDPQDEEEKEKEKEKESPSGKTRDRPSVKAPAPSAAPSADSHGVTVHDGGMGDGLIRDHDFRPEIKPFACMCRASDSATCNCGMLSGCLYCYASNGSHRTPVYADEWPQMVACLKALSLTKEERIAIRKTYGASRILRRYRWTVYKALRVKNLKKWFLNALEMNDIPAVKPTKWQQENSGLPSDEHED